MHNELGQPQDELQPNLPKKESLSVTKPDDESFIVPWNFKQHVMDALREPNMSDSDLAFKIIDAGKEADLVRELKQFHGLSSKVAYFLSLRNSYAVTKNVESFVPSAHKQIALKFIELSVNTGINLSVFDTFHELDEEVFNLLVARTSDRLLLDILNPERLAHFGIDVNTAVVKMFRLNKKIPFDNVTGLNQETALILLDKPTVYLVNIIEHANGFALSPTELDHLIEQNLAKYPTNEKNGFIIPLLRELTKPESQSRFPETTKAATAFGKEFLPGCPTIGSIETTLGLLKTIEPESKDLHPWEETLQQLEKLQAHATNTEYDPWETDLDPLVQYLKQHGLVSFSKPEDGKMLVEFVKRFGMSNTPLIARTFFEINKNGLGIIVDYLGEFLGKKIEPGTKDKSLLNELEQKQRWVLSELLRDEIPKELETKIGLELLNLIKGSTRWSQKDTPEDLIATWKKTAKEKPELAKLPEHYVEYQIEVPIVDRRVKTEAEEKDLEVKQAEVLALKTTSKDGKEVPTDLGVFIDRFVNASFNHDEFRMDINDWWKTQQKKLTETLYPHFNLEQKLEERKTVLMAKNISGEALEKALAAARQSLEKQQEKRLEFETALHTVKPPGEYDEMHEGEEIFQFMESLARILPKGSQTDQLFIALSIEHMRQTISYAWWGKLEQNTKSGSREMNHPSLSTDTFKDLSDFFLAFLSEHYLQPKQEKAHTGHPPFSPELLKALESAWGRTQKDPKKEHPFAKLQDKLAAIERGDTEETGKTKKISLVPAKGVMRIFSGDTGDACYTSQHEQLAEGEFPGITAYSFVTNRGTANERVQGSVLFIETIQDPDYAGDDAGKKVLLVRANNPRENLLSQVDADKLVQETLNVAIDLAKQRGIDIVVVPRDNATESSSNRPDVSKYYKQISSWHKVPLLNTPETNFNGYNNWDPDGSHPAMIVWRKAIVG